MRFQRKRPFLRIGTAILATLGALGASYPAQSQRISDLPAASSVNSADLVAVVQMPGSILRRTTAGAIAGLGTFPSSANGTVIANISGATGAPSGVTLTQLLNALACTPQGSLLYRSATAWTCLGPSSTSGYLLKSNGTGADLTWTAPVTPAGTTGLIQYNSSGAFAAMPTMSGDATLATSTGVLTLAASGVTANSYGSTSLIPVITVDAKGRLTSATTAALGVGSPAGTAGQLQYNNAGSLAGMTAMSGDCTLNTGTGAITCTKTAGTTFATIATSGSASDLATGTAPIARVPTGTVTSASTVPLNNDGRLNSTFLYLPIGSPSTATTTAAPASDILFSGPLTYSIAASTAPVVKVGTNPAATLSVVLKKNATTTLCTISISTSGVASGCSIGATSFVSGDYITAETGADASATGVAVSIPVTKAN